MIKLQSNHSLGCELEGIAGTLERRSMITHEEYRAMMKIASKVK